MAIELIAEVASSHGGDLELAKAFIWQCAEAGADWVKFQSYQATTLRPTDPQRAWLAQAELSDDAHYMLRDECRRAGAKFLTTAFHASRVPFLAKLGMPAIKIGSGEAGEADLFKATGQYPWRRFVSAGLQNMRSWVESRCERFRCVSRYPAPANSVLCFQPFGAVSDGRYVGWSDHCVGINDCELAILRGARLIEKHVALREQKRERRPWEATIEELKLLRQFADEDPQQYIGRWQYTLTQ